MSRILLIFFGMLSVSAYGQTDTLIWHEGIQLQVEDFRSKSREENLDISYSFSYQLIPTSFYRWIPIFRSRVVFNRKNSSFGGSKTRNALRYAQVMFDLHGLHLRRLELKIQDLVPVTSYFFKAEDMIAQSLREAENEMKKEIGQFDSEISQAFNMQENPDPVFLKWEEKIKTGLRNTPRVELREETGIGLGLFVGAGHSFLSGKTAACFTNPTVFSFGFQFDGKKYSRFGIDMRIGSNKTLQPLQFRGDWEKGLRTNLANIEFTYGYRIPGRKVRFVPYAGLAVNEFTPRKADNSDKRRIDGYSPVIGLEFNHIVAELNNDPREMVKFFYKCKVSCNPSNFVRHIAGPQFNFSLTLGFEAVPKRLRMVKVPAAE